MIRRAIKQYNPRRYLLNTKDLKAAVTMSSTTSKNSPLVSPDPGSTVLVTEYNITKDLRVFDTPGINFLSDRASPTRNLILGALGCIPLDSIGPIKVAKFLVTFMDSTHQGYFREILKCSATDSIWQILLKVNEMQIVETVGFQNRSRLDNYEFAAITFINLFREGIFGKIHLDATVDEQELQLQSKLLLETEPPGPWGPSQYPRDLVHDSRFPPLIIAELKNPQFISLGVTKLNKIKYLSSRRNDASRNW